MRSMLVPSAATARATAPNASAVIGRPSTMMVCVEGSRMIGRSSLRSMLTSRPTPWMAASTSARSSLPSATSRGADTSTPKVSRPRITTCSTLSSSTLWPARTSKSADVTPGLSTPVTVISADTMRGLVTPDCRWDDPSAANLDVVLPGDVFVGGTVRPPHMRLGAKSFHHVRIVQLESRALGTDPGQLGEVVPRRRATGGPLQRVAVAPRVVDGDHFAVPPALEDVPDERKHRHAKDERPDRGHDVVGLESIGGQVIGVAARHTEIAQPVLNQERGVKTDERQPEMQLAQPLVEQPAGHLREPEVDTGERGEHDGAEQHVVKVRDHEIAVGDVEVQRRAGQQHTGQPTQQERDHEADRKQHRRLKAQLALPHCADP